MIEVEGREAERYLKEASAARRPGRFQLEAAIQSVHARRAVSQWCVGQTDGRGGDRTVAALAYLSDPENVVAGSLEQRLGVHGSWLASTWTAGSRHNLELIVVGRQPVELDSRVTAGARDALISMKPSPRRKTFASREPVHSP